jgi:hypothetical protein
VLRVKPCQQQPGMVDLTLEILRDKTRRGPLDTREKEKQSTKWKSILRLCRPPTETSTCDTHLTGRLTTSVAARCALSLLEWICLLSPRFMSCKTHNVLCNQAAEQLLPPGPGPISSVANPFSTLVKGAIVQDARKASWQLTSARLGSPG